MARNYSMDMTKGSVFKKLLIFALPLCAANLLQQLYHSADMVVVGKFAEDGVKSLAAVGATNSVTNLLLHMFVGLSAGANVLCANRVGAKDKDGLERLIHSAVPLSALCGLLLAVLGFVMTPILLDWMNCPREVIKEAALYMRIIFLGQPASIVYNFGSGILRAHGDTKRPMYILMVTGFINVLFNLLFVIVFGLDTAGVALATILANYLSAAAVLYILFSQRGEYRMDFSKLRLEGREVKSIAKVGIPAGLNGIVYSFSNVIIVSSINELGKDVVAATSASTAVSAIAHTVCTAVATAAVSFSGQNYGARNFKRINKVYWNGVLISQTFMIAVCIAFTMFPSFFLGLYTDDAKVIRDAYPKLMLNNWGYLFCIFADMANCCLRGMKCTGGPTLANMLSVCVPRLIWVLLIFPFLPVQNLGTICIAYPLSWFLCAVTMLVYFHVVKRREERRLLARQAA